MSAFAPCAARVAGCSARVRSSAGPSTDERYRQDRLRVQRGEHIMLHMSSKHARRRPKRSARRIPTRERRKYPRHAPTIMCTSVSCLANHWYADPPVCGPDNAVVRFRRHAHAVGADEHYTPRARAPIRSLPSLHELAGFETARVLRGDSAPPIHLAEPLRLPLLHAHAGTKPVSSPCRFERPICRATVAGYSKPCVAISTSVRNRRQAL